VRFCRFDDNRIGVIDGDDIVDITEIADDMPSQRWPLEPGDMFIRHLPYLVERMRGMAKSGARRALADVTLLSPVANPGKVIAAPVNYVLHQEEANADHEITQDSVTPLIDKLGLFLKSPTSVVGTGQGVVMQFPDRRIDHEIELAVIIGRDARNLTRDTALDAVAGYAIGLDISVRGTEDRSYRKSLDTFTVIGPMTLRDDAGDPQAADLHLTVNGDVRQSANTRDLVWDVPKLLEFASAAYPLHPGDIILTGTPEGVGPINPGDVMVSRIDGLGTMTTVVR